MDGSNKSENAFRTISEVAEVLNVPQHVLRFWETKFPQISPMKRAGGRRYYRPDDLRILRLVRSLLYQQGYTIKGARKYLEDTKRKTILSLAEAASSASSPVSSPTAPTSSLIGKEAGVTSAQSGQGEVKDKNPDENNAGSLPLDFLHRDLIKLKKELSELHQLLQG